MVGTLYAQRCLRPLATQLAERIPPATNTIVLGTESSIWAGVAREYGLTVLDEGNAADYAITLMPLMKEAEQLRRRAAKTAKNLWIVVFSQGSRHEEILQSALQLIGIKSGYLRQLLWRLPIPLPEGYHHEVLRDVVRYDGIDDFWAAMVGDRPVLAHELDEVGADAQSEARGECRRALAPYTAVDGTIRLPIEALWLTYGAGS